MSRLYCWIDSDTLRTTHTARASKSLNIRINYGSKDDSKRLLEVQVYFPKELDKPKVEIIQ